MGSIFSYSAWNTIWSYRSIFLNGFLNTVKIAAVALIIAMVIGFVLGVVATSGRKLMAFFSAVYVEFFQNTPLILQVCFLYYIFCEV